MFIAELGTMIVGGVCTFSVTLLLEPDKEGVLQKAVDKVIFFVAGIITALIPLWNIGQLSFS